MTKTKMRLPHKNAGVNALRHLLLLALLALALLLASTAISHQPSHASTDRSVIWASQSAGLKKGGRP